MSDALKASALADQVRNNRELAAEITRLRDTNKALGVIMERLQAESREDKTQIAARDALLRELSDKYETLKTSVERLRRARGYDYTAQFFEKKL